MQFYFVFAILLFVLQYQVVSMFVKSRELHILTPREMMRYHGKGTPACWHGGLLSDPVLAVLAAFAGATVLVAPLEPTFTAHLLWALQLVVIGRIAFWASWKLHESYDGKAMNPLVMKGKVQEPGKVHRMFQAECFTIFALYFLRPLAPSELPMASMIAGYVSFTVLMSKDPHLHLWNPAWFYSDDDFFSVKTLGTIVVPPIVLGGRLGLSALGII